MTFSRVASLVLAVGYLVAAWLLIGRDRPGLLPCAFAALLPLPFIWFSDALGDYSGPGHMGYVVRSTPGIMIAVAGWLFLLVIPPILIAVYS
jgi:hypothetical protein